MSTPLRNRSSDIQRALELEDDDGYEHRQPNHDELFEMEQQQLNSANSSRGSLPPASPLLRSPLHLSRASRLPLASRSTAQPLLQPPPTISTPSPALMELQASANKANEVLDNFKEMILALKPQSNRYDERLQSFVSTMPSVIRGISDSYKEAEKHLVAAQVHSAEAKAYLEGVQALHKEANKRQPVPSPHRNRASLASYRGSGVRRQLSSPLAHRPSAAASTSGSSRAASGLIRKLGPSDYNSLPLAIKEKMMGDMRAKFNVGTAELVYLPFGAVVAKDSKFSALVAFWDSKAPKWREGVDNVCGRCREQVKGAKFCNEKPCKGCAGGVAGGSGRICCVSLGEGYIFVFGKSGL